MSYGRQNSSFGSYNNYQSEGRRNSNSFSGEQNGRVKRRKFQARKRLASNDMDGGRNFNSKPGNIFKEPLPQNRSPGSVRDLPYRSPAREFLDTMKVPGFVEPQHAGSPWSWELFNRECKAWQDKHKLAYYKSRCMALEFENQMLFQQITTLIDENGVLAAERGVMPTMLGSSLIDTPEKPAQAANTAKKQEKRNQQEKQKVVEVKKDKEIEKKEGPKQPMGQKRQEELDLLYGKNANLIQGLETSLQLNFNRNCDIHQPKLWMVTPINPNTVDEPSDD